MQVIIENKPTSLNEINKNCLKRIDLESMSEDEEEVIIKLCSDEGQTICQVEGFLASGKACFLITHLRFANKDLKVQEELFKRIIDIVWDTSQMNYYTLAIQVDVLGSGIDYTSLEHLGFVKRIGNSADYYILNPQFVEIVEGLSVDAEAKAVNLKFYNQYQARKQKQLQNLNTVYINIKRALSDTGSNISPESYERSIKDLLFYEEAIAALGEVELIEGKDFTDNSSEGIKM